MIDSEIIVIGAGPVGMLASILSESLGMSVIVIEKEMTRRRNSRAIGITPPSLEIMNSSNLDSEFISSGVPVRCSEVHADCLLGRVSFDGMKTPYPFVLSIPQNMTETILENRMLKKTSIKIIRGHTAETISKSGDILTVSGKTEKDTNFTFRTRAVFACDGTKSGIRNFLKIPYNGYAYSDTFLMGDFEDNSEWGNNARLYFTPNGSVESFPLPGGVRRYVLRTPCFIKENTTDYLTKEIPIRSGLDVSRIKKFWESGFGVQRYIAGSYFMDGVFLCGDAAHTMSPIGGQNMNTGFADAELAAHLARMVIDGKIRMGSAGKIFDQIRRPAAETASNRAWIMMRLGTGGGKYWSSARNALTWILLHTSAVHLMKPVFTMLSVPNRNLRHLNEKFKKGLST